MAEHGETTVEAVLAYWLDEVGPAGWYAADAARDARIRARFAPAVAAARAGKLGAWRRDARGDLALLILLDQFPRNIWRGEAAAYASDRDARRLAYSAIAQNRDLAIAEPARQFFYLPLMHSEILPDQERCVRLTLLRMSDAGARTTLPYAQAHRADIRRFGRFPYRNAALGRADTPEEAAWLKARAA